MLSAWQSNCCYIWKFNPLFPVGATAVLLSPSSTASEASDEEVPRKKLFRAGDIEQENQENTEEENKQKALPCFASIEDLEKAALEIASF